MANSEDPDQTAPSGAVWSRSALFVQKYLSQYLEFLGIPSLHKQKYNVQDCSRASIPPKAEKALCHRDVLELYDERRV